MQTGEHVIVATETDEADVEGIAQNGCQLIEANPVSGLCSEATCKKFIRKGLERMLSRSVELEGKSDEGSPHRINGLNLPRPIVEVANWGSEREESLFETANHRRGRCIFSCSPSPTRRG